MQGASCGTSLMTEGIAVILNSSCASEVLMWQQGHATAEVLQKCRPPHQQQQQQTTTTNNNNMPANSNMSAIGRHVVVGQ